jgi:chemotaxis protein methyltransferase CheR
MSSAIEDQVQRFRAAITQRMGLNFDEAKLSFLAEVMERRADAKRCSSGLYVSTLENTLSDDERRALALELTVPETYFFRHLDQLRAFAEVALPERMMARASTRRLRILCAGCASGEEAYTLAIYLHDRASEPLWDTRLEAIDINPAMLEKARRARYTSWALRETPSPIQERWFRREGREFALDPNIRDFVQFRESNLVTEPLPEDAYDVIFCRNVLMYFDSEVMHDVISRFTRALAPGGYLFLGHAETLRGMTHDFHLCHTHGSFYYQRKHTLEAAQPTRSSERVPSPLSPEDSAPSVSWVETVQRAAARIKTLAEPEAAPQEEPRDVHERPTLTGLKPAFDLSLALELLKQERFQEALSHLAELPSESCNDPDVLLLHAALLTHSGELCAAQRTCSELLRLDELNTGAHYLLALCREGQGDRSGALEHDQVAVYLDPAFAMPRLHLGLMARRAGDRDSARRELQQALHLLQREDASRLLLFGGGFGRDALIALCRAEIDAAARA